MEVSATARNSNYPVLMPLDSRPNLAAPKGLLRIEDTLDAAGHIVLPPDVTLVSLIERNISNVGETTAYRYLDHTRSADGYVTELTWNQLGVRMRAIAARVQRVASHGDRVAILAPQGLDYVAGFFAALKAGDHRRAALRPRVAGPRRASRHRTSRFTSHRRADHVRGGGRCGVVAGRDRAPAATTCHHRRRCRRLGGRRICSGCPRPRRHLAPAVHLGIHPGAGRRGDHPPRGGHQPGPDDLVDRSTRPKHARRQLVTALPRHGTVDDRISRGVRGPLDTDVADGLHQAAPAVDPRVVGRLSPGPGGHRRTQLRV